MALGKIIDIRQNSLQVIAYSIIAGVPYSVNMDKAAFDTLLTNIAKRDFIIARLAETRRAQITLENEYAALINIDIVVPD